MVPNDKLLPAFKTSSSAISVSLLPAPINPAWIIEGTPTAACAELSRSADGTSTTCVWTCTPGRFNWFYRRDETLYLFEGAMVLNEGLKTERLVTSGDSVFFPAGSHATWHVLSPVRKLAFVRRPLPAPLVLAIKLRRKVKSWWTDTEPENDLLPQPQ
jgi:uncharacterized cupin superfamily protein